LGEGCKLISDAAGESQHLKALTIREYRGRAPRPLSGAFAGAVGKTSALKELEVRAEWTSEGFLGLVQALKTNETLETLVLAPARLVMLGALEDLLSAYNFTLRDIRFSSREGDVPNRGPVGPIDSRRVDALLRRNKRVGVARAWLGPREYQVGRHWPVFAEITGRVGSHPTLLFRVLRQNADALTGRLSHTREED
jgi:hypothetical protein